VEARVDVDDGALLELGRRELEHVVRVTHVAVYVEGVHVHRGARHRRQLGR
jgi:hypothetical protein